MLFLPRGSYRPGFGVCIGGDEKISATVAMIDSAIRNYLAVLEVGAVMNQAGHSERRADEVDFFTGVALRLI